MNPNGNGMVVNLIIYMYVTYEKASPILLKLDKEARVNL